MKKFSKKIYFWGLIAFAAVAIFATAISTMAWFTLVSPPSSSLVSGGADVNIKSVTGYKVPEQRKTNGFVDYANDKVINKEINADDYKTTENVNLEGEDLNFDVPKEGIGYYLLTQNANGIFKFSSDKSNYGKFASYEDGNILSLTRNLTTETPFRIRSYQMVDHKTDLTTVDIPAVGGPGTLNEESHEVTVNSDGNYKVWYDKVTHKVGLERLGDIVLNNQLQPLKLNPSASGNQVVWLNLNGQNWRDANGKPVLDVYNGSGHQWVGMAREGSTDYYSAKIPNGNWDKIIFVRVQPSWASGVNWDLKWNQTGNIDFPGDPYNCYKLTSYEGGEWTEYNPVQVKVGNGNYFNMTYDSNGDSGNGSWYYTIPSVADGAVLSFKKYGESISVTSAGTGSGTNINNYNGSNSSIICGGSNVTVYLNRNDTVWVAAVNTYFVKIGDTYNAMTFDPGGNFGQDQWRCDLDIENDNTAITISYSKAATMTVTASSDSSSPWHSKNNFANNKILGGGSTTVYYHPNDNTVWANAVIAVKAGDGDWHQMAQNPDNDDELCATGMNVTEGDAVSIKVNGAALTFAVKDGDLNNLNADKEIVKSTADAGMYLSKERKDLWVTGNKEYRLTVGGSDQGEMLYQSSGTFAGWYGISGVSIAANQAIGVTLTTHDGSTSQTLIADTGHDNNNFTVTGNKVLRGGTVDLYYNTGSNKLYVTPIYWAKVGTLDANATANGNNYTVSFGSPFQGEDSVKVYVNATELTTYTPAGAKDNLPNNCYGTAGNLKVIYDTASNGQLQFNTSTSKVYVDGYAPCYYVKVGTGEWLKMDENVGAENEVYLSINAAAGAALRFRKNALGEATTAGVFGSPYLNNYEGGAVVTAITGKAIYYNYSSNEVWVPGRSLTYYFYTEEGSPNAYLWENGASAEGHYNAAYPGEAMTADPSVSGLYSYTYTIRDDYTVNHIIFNLGSDQKKSVDIDIAGNDYADKYFYLTYEEDGAYHYETYDNLPSLTEDYTFYVHDPSNSFFGSSVKIYAWDSAGSTMPVAPFPGKAMSEVIPGSLWVCHASNAYDRMLFASSNGARKTADIESISSHNNGIYVATGLSDGTVSGTWTSPSSSETINAKIYINDVAKDDMAIGDKVTSNDYIYEAGIQAKNGDVLKVIADGVTYKDSSNFVVDEVSRPYLTISDSSITVKLGSSEETARFNFYVTVEHKLAIVMVPDLGNGFYIMPYQNSTEGFIAAKKMSSQSSTSATYAGFYAEKDSKVFLRSYVDAVDKGYELDTGVSSDIATCDPDNKMIINFEKSAYFTIEVSGNTVKIREFTIAEFLRLNALDQSKATSQSSIKGLHTAMVFEVAYQVTSSAFAMTPVLSVKNDKPEYLGVAASFTATQQTSGTNPYLYMTDDARYVYNATTNKNGLTLRSDAFELADSTFKTNINDGTTVYYVYFLVDYVYSANLANMPYGLNSGLTFHLRMDQA